MRTTDRWWPRVTHLGKTHHQLPSQYGDAPLIRRRLPYRYAAAFLMLTASLVWGALLGTILGVVGQASPTVAAFRESMDALNGAAPPSRPSLSPPPLLLDYTVSPARLPRLYASLRPTASLHLPQFSLCRLHGARAATQRDARAAAGVLPPKPLPAAGGAPRPAPTTHAPAVLGNAPPNLHAAYSKYSLRPLASCSLSHAPPRGSQVDAQNVLLASMPENLQTEVVWTVNQSWLRNVWFFRK